MFEEGRTSVTVLLVWLLLLLYNFLCQWQLTDILMTRISLWVGNVTKCKAFLNYLFSNSIRPLSLSRWNKHGIKLASPEKCTHPIYWKCLFFHLQCIVGFSLQSLRYRCVFTKRLAKFQLNTYQRLSSI